MAQAQNQQSLLQLGMEQVGWFKSKKIPVHTPGEVEYERAVANSNLLYRFARPACVLQPEHNSHIRIIIARAKEKKLPVCIKNGGHSYAGFSTINDGLLIDLVNMKRVDLDMEKKTVTMQAGAQWGHAYKELINDHHDGWIINGGRCPTVGVSGFTLGGGLGPFTRSFGMGSDTLLEATIITAAGETVTVKNTGNTKKEEDDLFWALCGAGGGNFGVVVELKMKLQELHGKDVVAGRFTWSPKHCEKAQKDFMDTMVKFYTTNWPNEMTIDSSWLCDLKDGREDPAVRFLVYYNGTEPQFDELIDRHLGGVNENGKEKKLPKQLKRRTLQEKSTRFLHETLVSQWSEETVRAFPSNPSYKIYTSFVFGNGKDEIQKITEIIKKEMEEFRKEFKGEQGLLQVTWIHCGGKASEKQPDESAYPWRGGVYHAYIMIDWQEKFLELDMRGFLEKMNEKLRPFSHSQRAIFINFPDPALKKDAHEDAYYGLNKERLRKIKASWDKDNFFGWSQGVQLPEKVAHHEGDECADVAGHEEFLEANELLDKIAKRQWETFTAPPINALVGGVQGVTGFAF
ncbi:FAD-binding PCMH-type domain-containing protein [Fusarium keratoplasticum]|uniref:FAD-binding PCMH-type domain-containing protein n=1 Tax=Fusarium keratoplasticum TaxID=1328300 RepID=A0ACC0R9B0_9HYPO|nr:FAD-binding PCMH-type domain-containing protein [Fusarium keratoplasticum]KAI8679855.1 FAD-binding PCMH-type domain-containing protein [Fusarium keratoplasticum]